MSAFVDPSRETFVYGCDLCPWWRGIALTLEDAEELAIVHEERDHGTHRARRNRDRRKKRHAGIIASD